MAADASLYNNIGRGVRSVADYDAERLQGQANKLSLLLNQQKADEYGRGIQEQNALRDYLGGGADLGTAEGQQGLYRAAPGLAGVTLKDFGARRKDAADADAKRAETKQKGLETTIKATSFHRDQLANVSDAQTAAQWIQAGYQDPDLAPVFSRGGTLEQAIGRIPQDPDGLREWIQQNALGAQKFIEQNKPTIATRNTGGTTDTIASEGLTGKTRVLNSVTNTQSPESIASNATQQRGQNMADQRQREAVGVAMSKPFEVTGPDGLPVLVQQDKQGNISPVQGYSPKSGSSKPLNDTQAKALLFGTRMQEANKALESLNYSPAAINSKAAAESLPLIGGVAGVVGNAMLSDQSQQAEQAQRDFINAVLRRESGAVISDSEFSNARRQYFPQPNDKKENLAQKARNRQLAIDGLLAEVPEGRRASITPTAPAASGGFTYIGKE